MQPATFRHQNLRGRSFKGQDLSGQDFHGADIRGANFTNARLIGATFSQAKAGLRQLQVISLGSVAFFLFVLAGFIIGYSAGGIGSLLIRKAIASPGVAEINAYGPASGIFALLILVLFFVVTLQKGLALAGVIAVTISAFVAMLAAFATAAIASLSIVQAMTIAGSVAGVLYGAVAVVAVMILSHVKILMMAEGVVVLSALVGIFFGVPGTHEQEIALSSAIAAVLSIILIALSLYAGWQSWTYSPKYRLIRRIAMALMSQGTQFRGADLTEANFAEAVLPHTNLKEARLVRTNWFRVKALDRTNLEATYLEDSQIRTLVITKDGHNQNFDRRDLRGLNLCDANLIDASFIGADLGESTLQRADLSRAKLVQTQLQRTNLTQACLTGAFIQDWGISTETKLEQVHCDYVYMRLPTTDDPDPCRKPDNRQETFKEGDFSDFMAPILKTLALYRQQNVDPREIAQTFKTLDLYHHQGIDPTAAAIALKEISNQYPEANLEVIALEGRGGEKIRLQAVVNNEVDRSQLSADYFAAYDEIKKRPYPDLQTLLTKIAQKDEQIRSLEQMVKTAIESNKFYVETYYNLGDTMSEKYSINTDGGNVSGVVQGNISNVSGILNLGTISGDVTNAIQQLSASPAPDNPGLKELLTQLQAAIEAEAELQNEDKAEALEQVKTLAEAGQNPKDNALQKAAKTAMKILKGTVASLPEATKLAEACAKLLPLINSLLV